MSFSRATSAVTTTAARRALSSAASGPKLHRAKKTWWLLEQTRPHVHEHVRSPPRGLD